MNGDVVTETNAATVVYIRPLKLEDAQISFAWRNNPRIWKYTGSKPDKHITFEIEHAWLEEVLKRGNEKRFAICDTATDKYIGNVFLTDIDDEAGHVHIFIGEMDFWGGGRANEAIRLITIYGFSELGIKRIYCEINKRNLASQGVAKATGFEPIDEYYDESKQMTLVKFVLTNPTLNNPT